MSRYSDPAKRETILAQTKKWYADNPEWARRYHSAYRQRPEVIERFRQRDRRRAKDPRHRLDQNCRTALRAGIKTGRRFSEQTQQMLGYSANELRSHLGKLLQPGMSWANHGEWHIDHVVPLGAFAYADTSKPAFKEAWCLSNLQPLWAFDNCSKGARVDPEPEPVP